MSMALAWVVFPLVLGAVCLGCGLLVERISGRPLPGALLPSVGLALVIVVAELATYGRATSGFATPLVVLLAIVGYALSWNRLRTWRPDAWVISAALAVFAVMAAPVVLSGHATFLGYFFLNDTTYHFALVDQLFGRGRDVTGLPNDSFAGIVGAYLDTNYPVGAQLGLGALRPLVGQDVAWVFQPYLATMLALAGAALYQLLAGVVESRRLRALTAFVVAQPGLVYAYYLQGSIKELGTLWVLIVIVALLLPTLAAPQGWRRCLPMTVVVAAAIDILNLAVAPWIALPLAAFAAGSILQVRRRAPLGVRAGPVLGLAMVGVLAPLLALPATQGAAKFATVAKQVLTASGDLGNLTHPLHRWQLLGIWPNGDYRLELHSHQQIAFALMGIAIASAAVGGIWLLRRMAVAPLVFGAASAVALVYLTHNGSPYANGKTMMIASPAVVLAAMIGACAFWDRGRRFEGWLLAAAIAGGVIWTNGLAYHYANLAPRARLAELQTIGERFHDRGPTLLGDWEDYAAHFLRKTDIFTRPLAVTQLAPGVAPPIPAKQKFPYDFNDFSPAYVQGFKLLVSRHSPLASSAPANFRRAWSGRFYDVWQRRGAGAAVLEHIPLGNVGFGNVLQPAAVTSCSRLQGVGRRASQARAQLAYVERPRLPAFVPATASHPSYWGTVDGDPLSLIPRGPAGAVDGTIDVSRATRYRIWVEGSFDRTLTVLIGGRRVGSVGHMLSAPGGFMLAGTASVSAGAQPIRIVRAPNDLSPGHSGTTRLLGPVILDPVDDHPQVRYIAPRDYRRLCGKRLEWVEIVR